MQPDTMFGPLDVVLYDQVILYVLLGLVVLNAITRMIGHRRIRRQSESDGVEAVTRFVPHTVANALLFVGAVYYTTVSLGAGIILTFFVVAMIVADVFEFEARLVDIRNDREFDLPKGAITAWAIVAIYVAYRALDFVVDPLADLVMG